VPTLEHNLEIVVKSEEEDGEGGLFFTEDII